MGVKKVERKLDKIPQGLSRPIKKSKTVIETTLNFKKKSDDDDISLMLINQKLDKILKLLESR